MLKPNPQTGAKRRVRISMRTAVVKREELGADHRGEMSTSPGSTSLNKAPLFRATLFCWQIPSDLRRGLQFHGADLEFGSPARKL